MTVFRIYTIRGCPHCVATLGRFFGAGVPPEFIEIIDATNDEVINRGLLNILGEKPGYPQTLVFGDNPPVLVRGNDEKKHNELIESFLTRYRAITGNGNTDASKPVEQAEKVAGKEIGYAETPSGVPAMSGSMDSTAGAGNGEIHESA